MRRTTISSATIALFLSSAAGAGCGSSSSASDGSLVGASDDGAAAPDAGVVFDFDAGPAPVVDASAPEDSSPTTGMDAAAKGLRLDVSASPSRLGILGVGQTAPTSIRVRNPSSVAVGPITLRVVGLAVGSFGLGAGCDETLAPGASCEVTGRFTAEALGASTFQVEASAGATASGSASLSVHVATPSVIGLAPSTADFGDVTWGQRSAPKVFVVTNQGTGPARAPSIMLTGAGAGDYQEHDDCSKPLAPGATCTVSVTVEPSSAGVRDANLSVLAAPGPAATATLSATGTPSYGAFTDDAAWETFDLAAVNVHDNGYVGGAFDGRYVYLVPYANLADPYSADADDVVTRYDTSAPFASVGSWSTFETSHLGATLKRFSGAIFDGRYLYLSPNSEGVSTRYDTRAPFADETSWEIFDIGALGPQVTFVGGFFDGRYVYFTPSQSTASATGLARYDTRGAFTAAASWSTFDIQSLEASADGYGSAAFDGRYAYFAPNQGATAARLDTTGPLDAATSWSFLDLTAVDPTAKGGYGATFDGRFVYFPQYDQSMLQLDTQQAFDDVLAWSAFDLGALTGTTYYGGVFDGRYVTFMPVGGNRDLDFLAARFDTSADSMSASAWSSHAVTNPAGMIEGYAGGAFDGRYVYMVPFLTCTSGGTSSGGVVARFDAKQPPSMPAAYHGSFL